MATVSTSSPRAATIEKTKGAKARRMTDVERAEAIEELLALDIGNEIVGRLTIRERIEQVADRQAALAFLANPVHWWHADKDRKFSSAGNRGFYVAGFQGAIPWDDVIDEAIDADAGAETWETAGSHAGEPGASAGNAAGQTSAPQGGVGEAPPSINGDVVLGPNGPLDAATARQVNGKPRATGKKAGFTDNSGPPTDRELSLKERMLRKRERPASGPVNTVPIESLAQPAFADESSVLPTI